MDKSEKKKSKKKKQIKNKSKNESQDFKKVLNPKLEELERKKIVEIPLKLSTDIRTSPEFEDLLDSITETNKQNIQYPINENLLQICQNGRCLLQRNEKLDNFLYSRYRKENRKSEQKSIISNKREEILDGLEKNSIIIIHGEPQSGKTTQIPQLILDDFISKGKGSLCKIVSAQPFKKGVIKAYEKVCEERREKIGNSGGVSYQIRFESHVSRNAGSIFYCTNRILMNKISLMSKQMSHLIIDEIQERDVWTDFLLAFFKQVLNKRTDLKLILICTSVYSSKIIKYFDNCPNINVSPNLFPIKEYFLEEILLLINYNNFATNAHFEKYKSNREKEKSDLYSVESWADRFEKSDIISLFLIITLIKFICCKYKRGNILILIPFLTTAKILQEKINDDHSLKSKVNVINTITENLDDFNTNRKIYLAQNVKSIDLNTSEIIFVVNLGKIRDNFSNSGETTYFTNELLKQHTNFAGRYAPGICFNMITENTKKMLKKYSEPQILLQNLDQFILEVKQFGIDNIELFFSTFLDCRALSAIKKTIDSYKIENILTADECITVLGNHVLKLPLKYSVGKMVILGALFSCLKPILFLAAILNIRNIYRGTDDDVYGMKQNFNHYNSCDFLFLLNLLNESEASDKEEEFLEDFLIPSNSIGDVKKIVQQLTRRLISLKFLSLRNTDKFNVNSKNLKLVKALLSIALFPNIAVIRNHASEKLKQISIKTISGGACKIHFTSINLGRTNCLTPIMMYQYRTTKKMIELHNTTFVTPLQVLFFANNVKYCTNDEKSSILSINDNLKIYCTNSTCNMIKKTKEKFDKWFQLKLQNPRSVNWDEDSRDTSILRSVIGLLDGEQFTNEFLFRS